MLTSAKRFDPRAGSSRSRRRGCCALIFALALLAPAAALAGYTIDDQRTA